MSQLASVINDASYHYVGVKPGAFADHSYLIGLNSDEILALTNRFSDRELPVSNGLMIKGYQSIILYKFFS